MTSAQNIIGRIIERHAGREGALLPILHDVQSSLGCVDVAAERQIADALNLSRAEVHGVVSFYHDFTSSPELRPEIQLCRAEACQARGADVVAAVAEGLAGERVKITPVYCLGLCSSGPSARVGDSVYARLDEDRVAALLEQL